MGLEQLPTNLPVPADDGAGAILVGCKLPPIGLESTTEETVRLSEIPRVLVFVYPKTGIPGVPLPPGWDAIPGARGCTPELCAVRDNYRGLGQYVDRVFALSSQSVSYQREMAARLQLPFPVLSDERLTFSDALGLPTFEADGETLLKRLTFVAVAGVIEKVFYPVFPPDDHPAEVLQWLERTSPR